jgi:SAM-dependent methyltransferase
MNKAEWTKEDNGNKILYTRLLSEHGTASVRSLDWGSRDGQDLRFRVLTEIGVQKGDAVLDVGCGLGDYYKWLKTHSCDVVYRGVDITTAMIDSCRQEYPGIDVEILNILDSPNGLSPLEQFDYVVASGVFAKRPLTGTDYLQSFVSRMYELCRKGVAFNSLSSWAQDKQADEFYADPFETLAHCRRLTPWVLLRSDYHNRDFTIYMYRARRE